MSGRERLMAAFRHQETDRIPWSPLICGYYSLGFPEPLRGNDLAIQRAIGCDICERTTTIVYSQAYGADTQAVMRKEVVAAKKIDVRDTWSGDELLRVFETPIGTLQERYLRRETSPWILFPVEGKVKTIEDLKVLRYIYEAERYEPANYAEFVALDREIGDDGLNAASAPISPFQALLEVDLGVERFHYFLADYPDEMKETMEVMHAKYLEAARIVAESPAEVVIIYENTSTSYMTPYMFPQYVLPHLNEYVDLCHAGGKLVIMHMCGKLKNAVKEIAQGHYDGICDMAPLPTGDLDLAEAKEAWGTKLSVWGGIDATAFAHLTPQQMKVHATGIMERIAKYRGVILGSGDAVPLGTPLETLQAVTEAVNEFRLR